jgi:uncharacterized protein (DUF2235 family)
MKRIVICCDGTWNRADQLHDGEPCPTNVVKLAFRAAKRDAAGTLQVVFYGQGVGTGNALDRYSGGAFGHGLEANIHEAYRFLVGNYEAGDEIFVFGFSRGAFTARSLCGMLRNCGILQRGSLRNYHRAVALYRDPTRNPDHAESVAFRRENSVCGADDVAVRFIGVWDTVGALGIPLRGLRALTRGRHQFHDHELSGTVQDARHALAIDERRAPFQPTLWRYKPKPGQTIRQVWFPGVHSDIGGGYPDSRLSDIALGWMIEEARGCGLAFDDDVFGHHPLDPAPGGTLHNSRTGLYRLTRSHGRVIGGDPTQSVHPSALARWDADASYRPAPLRRHLADIGDARLA